MSLRRTYSLGVIVGLAAAGVVFLLFEYVALLVSRDYEVQIERQIKQAVFDASRNIAGTVDEQLNTFRDFAVQIASWDSFAHYLDARQDEEWFKRNIFPGLIEGIWADKIESVVVLDTKTQSTLVQFQPLLGFDDSTTVFQHPFVQAALMGESKVGYISNHQKLSMFAVVPVTPTLEKLDVKGVLVIGGRIDFGSIARVASVSGISLSLLMPDDSTPPDPKRKVPTFIQALNLLEKGQTNFDLGAITSPLPIRDFNGDVAAIAWISQNMRMPQSQNMLAFRGAHHYFLYALVVSALVGFLFYYILQGILYLPLKKVIESRNKATKPGDSAAYSTEIKLVYDILQMEKKLTSAAVNPDSGKFSKRSLTSEAVQRIGIFVEMAGGLAHNLNNLLTSILGSVSLLNRENRQLDSTTTKRLLTSIGQAAERCATITQDLLTMSKVQRGQVSRNPVQVTKTILDVISTVGSMNAAQGYEICYVGPSQPMFALCNESGLHQVLLNLGTNAIDAMSKPGKLEYRLSLAQHEGEKFVSIEVVDQGEGISEELRERIFEPFFSTKHAGDSTKKKLGGTGLGLTTALSLVQSWGGQITCSSEVGKGTTFRILLAIPGEAVVSVSEEQPSAP